MTRHAIYNGLMSPYCTSAIRQETCNLINNEKKVPYLLKISVYTNIDFAMFNNVQGVINN